MILPDVVSDKGCCGCEGGRFNVAQARMYWLGFDGFLQDLVGVGCNPCPYGNLKYLVRTVAVSSSSSFTSSRCVWGQEHPGDPFAWFVSSGSTTFSGAHNEGVLTMDRFTGITTLTDSDTDPGAVVSTGDGGVNCWGSTVQPGAIGTQVCFDVVSNWVDHWGGINYRCGKYSSVGTACSNFPGGTKAELEAWFAGFGATSIDVVAVTDTKIEIHIAWTDDYTNEDQDCPTDPPPDPGVGHDGPCLSGSIRGALDIEITLSSPYGFDGGDTNLLSDTVDLLGNYMLNLTTFRDDAGGCQGIPVLFYRGNITVPDEPSDGALIHSWTDPIHEAYPFGAMVWWVPQGDGGLLFIQKYAFKMGRFRAYGWQDVPPATPTRKFMRQTFTLDNCSTDASYSCADLTGDADRYVMCFSPNGETWTHGITFTTGTVQPIRNDSGWNSLWQGVFTDAKGDTWPASDPSVAVEPLCSRNCPNPEDCTFGFGVCPAEPEDNYPVPP